jgi:hypothetical protein
MKSVKTVLFPNNQFLSNYLLFKRCFPQKMFHLAVRWRDETRIPHVTWHVAPHSAYIISRHTPVLTLHPIARGILIGYLSGCS